MNSDIPTILKSVADLHGLTVEDLQSPSRKRKLARARQEAYWLCKELARVGYVKIGLWLNRDHTTVMYGVRAYKDKITKTPEAMTRAFNLRRDVERKIIESRIAA